jgi:predicted SprT family Zn-dependent metalloprotease
MELKIIGETGLDFFTDLQKLAMKHKIAIMTSQQKKESTSSDTEDLVFQCRKCEHLLYVSKEKMDKIESLPEYDCPECGEEGYLNWILSHSGNYEKDYGGKK